MLFSVNFSKCSEKNPFPTLVRCYQWPEVGQKSQKTNDGSGVMTVDQLNQTSKKTVDDSVAPRDDSEIFFTHFICWAQSLKRGGHRGYDAKRKNILFILLFSVCCLSLYDEYKYLRMSNSRQNVLLALKQQLYFQKILLYFSTVDFLGQVSWNHGKIFTQ